MTKSQFEDRTQIADLLAKAATTRPDKDVIKKLASVLRRSLKVTRKGVTVSGQGLSDLLVAVAPRIPVRTQAQLESQYSGMTGAALAGQVIRSGARNSGAIGAVTGALASAQEIAIPFWVMLPAEIITETLLIAINEMRMVAELHEVYGESIAGDANTRGMAILSAWSERRGVPVSELNSPSGLSKALGRNTQHKVTAIVKRKLMMRAARNVTTLAPLFVGAVAAAELNRRATRELGDAVVKDLAKRKA